MGKVPPGQVGPNQTTQVRSGWVVCSRRAHEVRLVGIRGVRPMSDLFMNDIDIEPSSEPSACVDIDARGRPGGRMALKSLPVIGPVVC